MTEEERLAALVRFERARVREIESELHELQRVMHLQELERAALQRLLDRRRIGDVYDPALVREFVTEALYECAIPATVELAERLLGRAS